MYSFIILSCCISFEPPGPAVSNVSRKVCVHSVGVFLVAIFNERFILSTPSETIFRLRLFDNITSDNRDNIRTVIRLEILFSKLSRR